MLTENERDVLLMAVAARVIGGSVPPEMLGEANAIIVRAAEAWNARRNATTDTQHSRMIKRGSRIPDNWEPSVEERVFASSLGFSSDEINVMASEFRDYWKAQPGHRGCKLDWGATWRNWARRDARKRGLTPPKDPQVYKRRQMETVAWMVRRKLRGRYTAHDVAECVQDGILSLDEAKAAGWYEVETMIQKEYA